jgi:endo-1,4-beta-D-glucanase Y
VRLTAIVLACALSLVAASCGSGDPRPASSPTRSGRSPDKQATDAAYAFLNRYTAAGGRIQRTDQGGDTVGEGQAYGMLAAAAVGDQRRFEQIWSWTRRNLLQRDGLLAFRWVNGRVVDPQAAADADLDAARALLVASCRFQRPDLHAAAVRIGQALLTRETAKAGSLEVLIAGPWADKGGSLVFNPSYVDPTTLDALARASGNARFRAVSEGSTRLVAELTRPLPPDWATVNTTTEQVTPVAGAGVANGPGMFTYDAPRALIRMAVNPDPTARGAAARAWGVFKETQPQDIVTGHQLSGTAVGGTHSPITLVAAAGAAKAAGDSGALRTLLDVAQQFNTQHPTYYGAAWVALGRLLLTTSRLEPCTG